MTTATLTTASSAGSVDGRREALDLVATVGPRDVLVRRRARLRQGVHRLAVRRRRRSSWSWSATACRCCCAASTCRRWRHRADRPRAGVGDRVGLLPAKPSRPSSRPARRGTSRGPTSAWCAISSGRRWRRSSTSAAGPCWRRSGPASPCLPLTRSRSAPERRGEALVPAAVLFVFVAALGADRHRVGLTLGLVAAGFLAAALLRARFAQPPRTSLGRARHPRLGHAAGGGPRRQRSSCSAPGSSGPDCRAPAPKRSSTRANDSGGVTEVISPLVDIRTRLVNRADTELFVVTASQPTYWRVSGAAGVRRQHVGAARPVARGRRRCARRAPPPGATPNEQQIAIAALRRQAGAGAAEPVEASGRGPAVERRDLDARARRSRARDGRPLRRSCRRCRGSTPDVLRAATSDAPPDPIYRRAARPTSPSRSARPPEVTAGAADDLRPDARPAGLVPHQLPVQPRGPAGPRQRAPSRPSCASASATASSSPGRSRRWPARSASRPGSPSGSRPGSPQADGDAARCSASNAHAWPEVWFDEFGWVAVRADAGPGRAGRRELHRRRRRPGRDGRRAGRRQGERGGADAPTATRHAEPTRSSRRSCPTGRRLVPTRRRAARCPTTVPTARRAGRRSPSAFLVRHRAAVCAPASCVRWRRAPPECRRDPPASPTLWRRALGAVEATGVPRSIRR